MRDSKKVAILGGGHGAHAMSADLIDKGFSVNFFEMEEFQDNVQKVLETKKIECIGEVKGKFTLNKATTCIDEAIEDVKYILVVTPAFAHKPYAELLKGKVKEDQIIVFYPGAFAALLFKSIFGDEPLPIIAEVNNLPYDARVVAPGKVNILGRNPVNIAFFPAEKSSELIEEARTLHPFERVYQDVLESGLSIVNPTFHSGLCLLSVTAIENSAKRPFFLYEHGITPASAKLDLKLDLERKALGKALGYNLTPIEDFSGMKEGYTWQELYMNIHGNISLTPICGPTDIENRYLTEDASCGLVPWSYLGKVLGVNTTIIDSIVNVYNIIHDRDWWKIGRNLEDLGIEGMSVEEIHRFLQTGDK